MNTSFGLLILLVLFLLMGGCGMNHRTDGSKVNRPILNPLEQDTLFLGVDLSYVNEMEDCGGTFKKNGVRVEPFQLFADKGANLIRVRLWHSPDWTNYSNLQDVKRSIKKVRISGANVLLDFHYSDDWADPHNQIIPHAWKHLEGMELLGDSVYLYTKRTLLELAKDGLLPEMVQIGNEINSEILMSKAATDDSINWKRNVYLLNKGLQAVRDIQDSLRIRILTVIHIAQPENALTWFPKAINNGLLSFDIIGLSYYPKWSDYGLSRVGEAVETLKNALCKKVLIVETGYPHTLIDADQAGNILGEDSQISGFPISHFGQKYYLITLTRNVLRAGGIGVIYWEPAWVTNTCSTRWGKGSHWDNATFFDAQNQSEVIPAIDFLNAGNY